MWNHWHQILGTHTKQKGSIACQTQCSMTSILATDSFMQPSHWGIIGSCQGASFLHIKGMSSPHRMMSHSMKYSTRALDQGDVQAVMQYILRARILWVVRRHVCGNKDEKFKTWVWGLMSGQGWVVPIPVAEMEAPWVVQISQDISGWGGRGRNARVLLSVGGWTYTCLCDCCPFQYSCCCCALCGHPLLILLQRKWQCNCTFHWQNYCNCWILHHLS